MTSWVTPQKTIHIKKQRHKTCAQCGETQYYCQAPDCKFWKQENLFYSNNFGRCSYKETK